MNRRDFLNRAALAGSTAAFPILIPGAAMGAGRSEITWQRDPQWHLFTGVAASGSSLVVRPEPGLLVASCRLADESAAGSPLGVTVEHRLHQSGVGHGEDVLESTLTVRNTSTRPQNIVLDFATSAQPSQRVHEQGIYLPLCAAGLFRDGRFAPLGVKNFLKDCNQTIGADEFQCHYLEPMASDPRQRETRALLLAPVVDIYQPGTEWRVALFTPSDQPMRFGHKGGVWHAGRQITLPSGGSFSQSCWLMIHSGNAAVAWRAFHRFAHREEFPPIDWVREMKVHYYDFLSSPRANKAGAATATTADLPHFGVFRVGLATQHGYYPAMGDFIHPGPQDVAGDAGRQARGGGNVVRQDEGPHQGHASRRGEGPAIYMHADVFRRCLADVRPSSSDCGGRWTHRASWPITAGMGPTRPERHLAGFGGLAGLARALAAAGPLDHGNPPAGRDRDGRDFRGVGLRPSTGAARDLSRAAASSCVGGCGAGAHVWP